jgi:hypothetical protein
MNADDLAITVGTEASRALDNSVARIKHCLGQLSNEQVWHRPDSELNSIGNLLLHLAGNVRQWLVAGLGNAADTRNRPAEFAERGPIPNKDLLAKLQAAVDEAKPVLRAQTAGRLHEPRRIQGSQITGLAAIFDSVPHFQGHTQEIIHMTRQLLGKAYQTAWEPRRPNRARRGASGLRVPPV